MPNKSHAIEYTFRDGVKLGPDGIQAVPVKTQTSLSSNGLTTYLTILWSDNVLTCNCQGWAIRKFDKVTHKPVPRTCKHCKACSYSTMTDVNSAQPVETQTPTRARRHIRIQTAK